MEVNTTEQFQSLLSDNAFHFRFACGYTKPTHQIQLNDKEEFAHSIWLHHVLFRPYAELEQLWKGFQETLQIQLLVCVHGEEVRALLAYSTLFNVTLGYLQDAFAIQYQTMGQISGHKRKPLSFIGLSTSQTVKVMCRITLPLPCVNCMQNHTSCLHSVVTYNY